MTTISSGFVLVDKPVGLTSQQAVARVRKALGGPRAGHTGTLDPFASGLLLVLLGRATRLAPFVADEPKEYEVHIRFGSETDTDDATGEESRTAPPPSDSAIADAIATLTGDIDQIPPSFSAKHVAGARAYQLARRGVTLSLEPVRVRVECWSVLAQSRDTLSARITCSGGTYIRALARDLGRLTNSAAHCAALRRLRCGDFSVDDAALPDAVGRDRVHPALDAVAGLPLQQIDAAQASSVAHGHAVAATVAGEMAALVMEGELVAIAQRGGDEWRPRVVLLDPADLARRTSHLAPQ